MTENRASTCIFLTAVAFGFYLIRFAKKDRNRKGEIQRTVHYFSEGPHRPALQCSHFLSCSVTTCMTYIAALGEFHNFLLTELWSSSCFAIILDFGMYSTIQEEDP